MADPILLTWQLLDDYGNKRSLVYYLDSLETELGIQNFVTAHSPKLNAVTGCQPVKVTVTKPYALGAVKVAPEADHPAGQGAIAAFSAQNTAYRHSVFIPGFMKTLITGGQIVEAGDVATWTASMLLGEGSVQLVDLAGRPLTDFLSGTPRDRK